MDSFAPSCPCSSGGRWLRRRLVEEHSFDPLAGYKNPVPPYGLQQAVPLVVHLLEFAPAELDKGRPIAGPQIDLVNQRL